MNIYIQYLFTNNDKFVILYAKGGELYMNYLPIILMECEKLGIKIDFSKHDIKKYVMVELLLENGRKAHQFLFKEIKEFDPNLINYKQVKYPSHGYGRYGHFCKYMLSFNFIYGFIKEWNFLGIDCKYLIVAKTLEEKYYFGEEINFEDYIASILHYSGKQDIPDKYKSVLNTQYQHSINGNVKFIRHLDCPNCLTCLKKESKVVKPISSSNNLIKYPNEYFTTYDSKTIYEYIFDRDSIRKSKIY